METIILDAVTFDDGVEDFGKIIPAKTATPVHLDLQKNVEIAYIEGYFVWIGQQTDMTTKHILQYKGNKKDNMYGLLYLQMVGYITTVTLPIHHAKFICLTKHGKSVYAEMTSKGLVAERNEINKWIQMERKVAIDRLEKSICKFGYELRKESSHWMCYKGFGKYRINICSKKKFMEQEFLDNLFHETKSIIFMATTMEDKVDVKYRLMNYILQKFGDLSEFHEESYSFCIFTENEAENMDFPHKMP